MRKTLIFAVVVGFTLCAASILRRGVDSRQQ